MRPNIHIEDVVDLYSMLLEVPDGKIAGKIFNAGYENHKVSEIADIVHEVVGQNLTNSRSIEIVTTPTDDKRSYHISSEKIKQELGYVPRRSIAEGASDLVRAFSAGKLPNPMDDIRYYNIKKMQDIKLG